MECQIVPAFKHVCENNRKIKKKQKCDDQQQQNQQKKNTNRVYDPDDEGSVYILQPMFKPPKSTKDLASSNKYDDDRITLAVNAISDSNKNTDKNGQYNHFTMSRHRNVKVNTVSRVEDPFHHSSPLSTAESRCHSKREIIVNSPDDSHAPTTDDRRGQHFIDSPNRLKVQSRERIRRASAGDVLIKNNISDNNRHSARSSRHQNSNTSKTQQCPRVVSIGPDEVLLIPQQRRPSELDNAMKRRGSCKLVAQDGQHLGDNPPIPRRKSFHDWYSIQEWYLQEARPVSSGVDSNTRRNVISPCTLSRLLPNSDDQDPKQGLPSISVCTEGDRMSYNFNLPSRRLVSHRDLKNCSLPYSDNIGLEEAVSSDQARKLSKSKQSVAVKKKYETHKQTPKQVWYRTVRSILAANHLYHSVKRKNKTNL